MSRKRLADDLGRALTAENLDCDGFPVHRLKLLIGEALFRLPLHETLRVGRECHAHERHADGVSVSAREHHRNVDAAEAEAPGEAVDGVGVDTWRQVLRLPVGHGFHRRDVDVLAETAALGLPERNERRRSGIASGLQEALGHARDSHRRAVLVTAGVQEPTAGHRGEIRACPGAARAGGAVRRHRRMDDGGIDGGDLAITETQCGHMTDRRVLDECVRAAHKLQQSLPALCSAQIGNDTLLALVVGPVAQRAFRIRLVVDKWTQVAAAHAIGRFDGNHLSSQAGKQVARKLADSLAEIQDPVVLQHGVVHPSSASARSAARCRFFPVRAIHANDRHLESWGPRGTGAALRLQRRWLVGARLQRHRIIHGHQCGAWRRPSGFGRLGPRTPRPYQQ